MSASLIPEAATAVATATAEAPKPSKVRCDYCECQLGADGGVLRVSERAKELNRQDERIENLKRDISKLQGELDTAKADLAAARAELTAATAKRAASDDWD